MKTKVNLILPLGIIFIVSMFIAVSSNLSLSDMLSLQEIKSSELENKLELIEIENVALRLELKGVKNLNSDESNHTHKQKTELTSVIYPKIKLESENKLESEKENIAIEKNQSTNSGEVTEDNPKGILHELANVQQQSDDYVDINKPFNGVDPASEEQQELYNTFKSEVEGYNYDENFDLGSFMSDVRLANLHASLGSKLMNYVDEKLTGIKLIQDSDQATLTELD